MSNENEAPYRGRPEPVAEEDLPDAPPTKDGEVMGAGTEGQGTSGDVDDAVVETEAGGVNDVAAEEAVDGAYADGGRIPGEPADDALTEAEASGLAPTFEEVKAEMAADAPPPVGEPTDEGPYDDDEPEPAGGRQRVDDIEDNKG